jgi:uncharacterized protein (TIGR03437 family)
MHLQPLLRTAGPARCWIVLAALLLLTSSAAFTQQSTSLTLASGSVAPGGSISLNLSLNGAASSTPSGLQWTLSYPAGSVLALSSTAGPVLTAAGKSLYCNPGTGSVTCLADGMNASAIGTGVVAVVSVTLTSTSAGTVSIPMSYVMGAQADGTMTSMSGTGGVITVVPAGPPTVSTLQCTPASLASGAASTCTVTLSKAAPTGGSSVAISSNNAALIVPMSVAVVAGATTANFTATAGTFAASQAVTVTASLNGGTATAAVTLAAQNTAAGLLTAYAFSEGSGTTTADASGNGITGQLHGAAWTAGKWGNGLSFDGATAYVDLGTPASLQTTGSMTWTGWVNSAANPPDDGQIIAQSDNTTGWQLKTTPDTGNRTFAIAVSSAGGTSHIQRYSNTVPSLNTWYHVAGIYNAASQTLDIYVNGVLDNGTLLGAVPSFMSLASVNTTIGMRSGGYYFNGAIDNLRIYNRALSAAEIQADMVTPVNAGSGVTPTTVTALQCAPATVASGGTSTCTVTLSQAAPAGGTAVTVSDSSTALTTPASVTVAAGATTGNFTATAGTVTASQAVTVTATLNSSTATASVTITVPLPPVVPVTVTVLQCAPTTVASGGTSTCTATISQAAPTGGTAVTVSDSSTALTAPASVTVAAGATTAKFTATAGAVTANQAVTVTATLNSSKATASVTVTAPPPVVTVTALQCAPATVASGGTSTCTVTLSQAAPTGGTAVTVSDSSTALTAPASVTVAAGAATANFTATAGTVTANQAVTVTATLNSSKATASVTITAPPPVVTVTALQCAPATVASGGISTCTVTLSQAAPAAGTAVLVSDSSTALVVPALAMVAAGATTANFTATAGTVTANQAVTVTATLNSSKATASVTITAPPPVVTVTALQCAPATVASGGTSTCTATISQAAPTSGTAVTVSDSSTALTTPASVTVAAGAATANFTATAGTVTASQAVTVTATLNSSKATASVTITAPVTSSPATAAYAFSEGTGTTTADASGNGITGQLQGATWTVNGKHGNALSFNGSTSYVDLGTATPLMSTGSMTWSAWVNATGNPPDDGQIIARSNDATGWQLKTTPDTGVRTFAIAVSAPGGASHIQRYSKTVCALNTWYHVAGVYNAPAGTLDIYVNGILDNGTLRGTVPSSQFIPALNANIGRRSGGYYFKGIIDDVRIYNRSLAQAEIQSDMNTGVTVVSPAVMTSALTPAVGPASAGLSPSATTGNQTGRPATRRAVSGLSCSPKVVNAGSQVTCELRVTGSAAASSILLGSSSSQVAIPTAVASRPNQSRLTFQASVDVAAKQQAVTLTATLDGASVQDVLQVTPSSAPILTVPGKQFARFGAPLSFQITGADPSDSPLQLMAADIPAGAAFDPLSGRFDWTPNSSQGGQQQVTFTATNGAGRSSIAQVAIDVDSGAPVLTNAGACSPGAIGTLRGKWLAEAGKTLADATGQSLSLGGTTVKVNGEPVPALFASATRVNFICPSLEPGTQFSVAVATPTAASELLTVAMQTVSPEIFSLDGSARDQGVISFAETTDLAMERNATVPAHPAQPGDEILIWGTGFGAAAEDSARHVSVKLGDIEVAVESVRAVPGYAGVYTIQTRVPAAIVVGDAIPVEVRMTTPDSKLVQSNTVKVTVEAISQ